MDRQGGRLLESAGCLTGQPYANRVDLRERRTRHKRSRDDLYSARVTTKKLPRHYTLHDLTVINFWEQLRVLILIVAGLQISKFLKPFYNFKIITLFMHTASVGVDARAAAKKKYSAMD